MQGGVGPGRLCPRWASPSPALFSLFYAVRERYLFRWILALWAQAQHGSLVFRGAWGRSLTSLWVPVDYEKLPLLLLGSPGSRRSPTGSALPTRVRTGLGPSWSVTWQPRLSPLTEKLAYWDPNLGCLLKFPEPLLSLSWLVSPCTLGIPLFLDLEKTAQREAEAWPEESPRHQVT